MKAKRPYARRLRAYKAGLRGERFAALVLLLKGYRILHFRHQTGAGEVDLIVIKGKTVCMVEVKNRHGGATIEDVHPAQASRLVRAANAFLARNPQFCHYDIRFDIILTGGRRWPRHIKSAWQADAEAKKAVL